MIKHWVLLCYKKQRRDHQQFCLLTRPPYRNHKAEVRRESSFKIPSLRETTFCGRKPRENFTLLIQLNPSQFNSNLRVTPNTESTTVHTVNDVQLHFRNVQPHSFAISQLSQGCDWNAWTINISIIIWYYYICYD